MNAMILLLHLWRPGVSSCTVLEALIVKHLKGLDDRGCDPSHPGKYLNAVFCGTERVYQLESETINQLPDRLKEFGEAYVRILEEAIDE